MQIAAGYEAYRNSSKYDPDSWIDKLVTPNIIEWAQTVKIIMCVCDPVKRLRSDFLHVKADRPKAKAMNKDKIGPNSAIYPFRDLNFDQFVEKFVRQLYPETIGQSTAPVNRANWSTSQSTSPIHSMIQLVSTFESSIGRPTWVIMTLSIRSDLHIMKILAMMVNKCTVSNNHTV